MGVDRTITPWQRLAALKHTIAEKGVARIIEAHSGLSGIIGETARAEVRGELLEYDGLWESSLTDSASKGLPMHPSSASIPVCTRSTKFSMSPRSLSSSTATPVAGRRSSSIS